MPFYERIDAPANAEQKNLLKCAFARPARHQRTCRRTGPRDANTRLPATAQPFGGIKVVADNGWFAARPSGTEDVYKIYAESFRDEAHLKQIQQEAQNAIAGVFESVKAPDGG